MCSSRLWKLLFLNARGTCFWAVLQLWVCQHDGPQSLGLGRLGAGSRSRLWKCWGCSQEHLWVTDCLKLSSWCLPCGMQGSCQSRRASEAVWCPPCGGACQLH